MSSILLLGSLSLKAQKIPDFIVDLSKADVYQYTQSADTTFYLAWYLGQEKDRRVFPFLEQGINAAEQNNDALTLTRLKSIQSQLLKDIKGVNGTAKATVIKEYNDAPPTPKVVKKTAPIVEPKVVKTDFDINTEIEQDSNTSKEALSKVYGFFVQYYAEAPNVNIEKQIEYVEKTIELNEQLGNYTEVETKYEQLLPLYIENQQLEKAIEAHQVQIDSIKTVERKAQILEEIGDLYFEKEEYNASETFRQQLLTQSLDNNLKATSIRAYNKLGEVYQVLGLTKVAYRNHKNALDMSEKNADSLNIVISYLKFGILHKSLKDGGDSYEKANEYLDKGIEIAKRNNFDLQLIELYNEKTDLLVNTKQYANALIFSRLAGKKLKEKGDIDGLIENTNINGDISKAFVDYYEAKKEYQKSYELSVANDKNAFKSMNYADMGILLSTNGNYQAAIDSCTKGYEIAKKINYAEFIADNCNCLHTALKVMDKNKDALKYHEELRAINDSLFTVDKKKEIKKINDKVAIETKFQEEVNQLEIVKEQRKRINWLAGFLAILSILLGIYGVSAIRRLNENKKHSEQLHELNSELKIANDLQKQNNKKLIEANAFLENFAAVAAHDLKVPLRSIASFSKLLFRKNEAKFDEEDKEYFQFIAEDANRLQDMIEALLTFSKIGKDLPPADALDLNLLLQAVTRRMQTKINETNAIIDFDNNLPTIQAHYPLIEQVFQNIISNGLKFQKKHALARINIKVTKANKDNFCTISIADNGIGIDENEQDKIFELFSRLNKRSAYDGTGIGLATCKKIVQHYGGDIAVESKVNQGTTIHFSLPLYREG